MRNLEIIYDFDKKYTGSGCNNKNTFCIVYKKLCERYFFALRKEFTYLGRLFASICAAVLISTCIEGCRDGKSMEQDLQSVETSEGQPADSSGLSGVLRLAGSTSMEKLSGAWAEDFMERHPDVSVTTEFVGSSAGIEAVLSGSTDIGNSSRSLKESERLAGAVENLVAVDGIIVCVDPSNTVDGLTCRQLVDIYTGTIVNWAELGGMDIPMVVVGREAGSGTRSVFEELLGVKEKCVYANELDSTGAVMARIASTPGAIGYASMDMVDDSVKVLSLEGVEPEGESIRNDSYLLSSPLIMVTRGEIAGQDELVQAWFDYVYSEEGQAIAGQMGYIGVR